MKKNIAVLLAFIISLTIFPCNIVSAKQLSKNDIPDLQVINQVNKILSTDLISKCMKSERYAYWNFYISMDSNALSAYGYRYADALYNLDITKALAPVTISRSDAEEVIKEYVVEYTKKNSDEYEDLALIDGLLDIAEKGSDAYSALVDMEAWNNNIDEKAVKSLVNNLTPWKNKMEQCLSRGEIDETTRAWILGGELEKTTAALVKAEQFDKLLFASSLISNGLKMMNFSQDLFQKYEELKILKYASSDALDLLDLLSTTAIDSNIKNAAIGVKSNLKKYKDANMGELFSYATGDTVVDYLSDEVLDKLKSISYNALKATGIKGCMTAGSLMKAVELGVAASNILFNAGNMLEQANKIRVVSLISLALSQRVTDELSGFVMAAGNVNHKARAARELMKYLPMLLLSRELGELQYYNMRQEADSGVLINILKIFGYNADNLDDWYKSVVAEMGTLNIRSVINTPNIAANQSNPISKIRGNSSGNIINGGIANNHLGWVYFSACGATIPDGVYKKNIDSGEIIKISDTSASNINIVDECIYFTNRNDGLKLYKMNIDGSQMFKLLDDKVDYVNVVDDWIYYIYEDTDSIKNYLQDNRVSGIYKVRLDGTEQTTILEMNDLIGAGCDLTVENGWIYFLRDNAPMVNQKSIYKIKTDGSGLTKISEDFANFLNVVDNAVYYSNQSDNLCLYKMNVDGTQKSKLTSYYVSNLNVDDGWVYYNNFNDLGYIYKIRTDGTDETKLNSLQGCTSIQINRNSLICIASSVQKGDDLYEIYTDGTNEHWITLGKASSTFDFEEPKTKPVQEGYMIHKNLIGQNGYISEEDQENIQAEITELSQQYGYQIFVIVMDEALKKMLYPDGTIEYLEAQNKYFGIDNSKPFFELHFSTNNELHGIGCNNHMGKILWDYPELNVLNNLIDGKDTQDIARKCYAVLDYIRTCSE